MTGLLLLLKIAWLSVFLEFFAPYGLKNHFKWTPHNLVAHPISEILHLVGFNRLGERLHDVTIPVVDYD